MVPETTVILSTLIPNKEGGDKFDWVNEQYPTLVKKFQEEGLHIVLAEMSDGGDIWTKDGTHPTGDGFRKMAAGRRHSVTQAEKRRGCSCSEAMSSSKMTSPLETSVSRNMEAALPMAAARFGS